MSDGRVFTKSNIKINAPRKTVWRYLLNDLTLEKALGFPVEIIRDTEDSRFIRRVAFKGVSFYVRYEENAAHLSGGGSYIDIILNDAGESTGVELSVIGGGEGGFSSKHEAVDGFLGRLKAEVEGVKFVPTASYALPQEEAVQYGLENEAESASTLHEQAVNADETQANEKKRSGKESPFLTNIICVVVSLLLVATAGYLGWRYLLPKVYDGEQADLSAYSNEVTYENALKLELGFSQSEVENIFGITGEEVNGKILYCSAELSDGTPARQVLIGYEKHIINSMTYLDIASARTFLKEDFTLKGVYPTEISVKGVADAAALPVSMYRLYYDANGERIAEVNFGYCDPYANFSGSWRGQFAVTLNADTAKVSSKSWVVYGAGDGLTVSSLEGTALSKQYSSYDDYLNDKFTFDRMMIMKSKYTKGDVKNLFGAEPVVYYDGSETTGTILYGISSSELIANTQTPVWRMSFGYDTKGHFRMCSFTNMRFINMRGLLDGTAYETVSKGMSYLEVRKLVGLMPTAIYFDESCYTVCFGRLIDESGADDQFELVVRMSVADDTVQAVFNNVARGEAIDAKGEAEGEA